MPRRMDGKNTAHWFGPSSTAAAAALRKEPDTLSDWFGVCQMCACGRQRLEAEALPWTAAGPSVAAVVAGFGRSAAGEEGDATGISRPGAPGRTSLSTLNRRAHIKAPARHRCFFFWSLAYQNPPPPSPPRGLHIRRAELPRGSLSGFRWRIKSFLTCAVMSNLAATAQVSAAGMQPLQTFELPGGFRGGGVCAVGVKARERMMQVVILG